MREARKAADRLPRGIGAEARHARGGAYPTLFAVEEQGVGTDSHHVRPSLIEAGEQARRLVYTCIVELRCEAGTGGFVVEEQCIVVQRDDVGPAGEPAERADSLVRAVRCQNGREADAARLIVERQR